ncbi:flagellar basal body P-ring biosynthesis protein [Wenjunlia tyrosinilytica]|uniref:Flagellar basal body P-ring biosynthesis protein n=1 Tax=Wenjunlia tyrosinilytica TaxID=1544741 RepID=A0A918DX13_9ACTN|nr:flagellar basal body P-ring biosynthesis protein [Wenjunlia tyrosinilytica]
MAAALAMTAAALLAAASPHAGGGRSGGGAGREVLVAARDLPGGTRLGPRDVVRARLPGRRVPAGASRRVEAVRGRTLAGPVRRGEPLTDRGLLGPALLAGYGHERHRERMVAAPVRITDAAAAGLLRAGDRIDVLAGAPEGEAYVVASGVRVVTVPRLPRAGADQGALVVLAVPRPVAVSLAGASARSSLTVALR